MQNAPISTATRVYLRILILLLALAGIICLAGLQAGLLVAAGKTRTPLSLEASREEIVVTATGPAVAWSQPIPVDTSLLYDISAEVRMIDLHGDRFAQTRIYLGVETLDENMKPLRSGGGSYRYSGALSYYLSPAQGWTKLEGTMKGEGDEAHSQFRPGTRFIRVVALLNHRSEGLTAEIRNVRFSPRIDLIKL